MKLFKKVAAAVLAGVMALSMVACGGTKEEPKPAEPEKPAETEQPAVRLSSVKRS